MLLKKQWTAKIQSKAIVFHTAIITDYLFNYIIRSLYLVQDMKTLKKERQKVEDKWKILTKQAATKNPNFKEPTGKFTKWN